MSLKTHFRQKKKKRRRRGGKGGERRQVGFGREFSFSGGVGAGVRLAVLHSAGKRLRPNATAPKKAKRLVFQTEISRLDCKHFTGDAAF